MRCNRCKSTSSLWATAVATGVVRGQLSSETVGYAITARQVKSPEPCPSYSLANTTSHPGPKHSTPRHILDKLRIIFIRVNITTVLSAVTSIERMLAGDRTQLFKAFRIILALL